MILKNLYFSYFKTDLRRNGWSFALSSLVFFLSMTLPVTMVLSQGKTHVMSNNVDELGYLYSTIAAIIGYENFAVKALLIMMAVISGISAFSYLHSKMRVDFYHSFPICRPAMFSIYFINGILPVVAGYVLNLLAACAVTLAFGYGSALSLAGIGMSICYSFIYFLAIYSICVIATLLTGQTVMSLVLSGLFLFGFSAVTWLYYILKVMCYETIYINSTWMFDALIGLSPVMQIFRIDQDFWITGFYLCIGLFLTGLALAIYNNRKSEKSGTCIAFTVFKLPVKILVCLLLGLSFATAFSTIANIGYWLYVGLVIGILLGHALCEIAFDFSFRSITKKKGHALTILLVCIGLLSVMYFDLTGFDKRTLSADRIQSYMIQSASWRYNNSDYAKGAIVTGNEEALAQLIYIGATEGRNSKNSNSVEDQRFMDLNIVVNKKGFGTFRRSYSVPENEKTLALYEQIRFSESYRKATQELYHTNLNKINTVVLRTTSSAGNDIPMDKSILDALLVDYSAAKAETLRSELPVATVVWTIEERHAYYNARTIPVYADYENTMAIINKKVPDPTAFPPLDVERILIHSIDYRIYNDYDSAQLEDAEMALNTSITDPEAIEALCENAVLGKIIELADSDARKNLFYYQATFYMKNGEELDFRVPKDVVFQYLNK